jgi:hypothetical protein
MSWVTPPDTLCVVIREPLVGFEPTTARLRIESSTPELQWLASNEGARKDAPPIHDALARIRTATPFGTTPSR